MFAFDVRLNIGWKQLSCWWYETLWCPREVTVMVLRRSLLTVHMAGASGWLNVFEISAFLPMKDALSHSNDVLMGPMASQITSLTIVCSSVYSGADQRKHKSSASLAFVRGIHRGPGISPHKGSVTRKMFRFDDVIMFKVNPCYQKGPRGAMIQRILFTYHVARSVPNLLLSPHWETHWRHDRCIARYHPSSAQWYVISLTNS